MSADAVEKLLARLYTDEDFLEEFLCAPTVTARANGLDEEEARSFSDLNATDLRLAAHSYARKRARHRIHRTAGGRLTKIRRMLSFFIR